MWAWLPTWGPCSDCPRSSETRGEGVTWGGGPAQLFQTRRTGSPDLPSPSRSLVNELTFTARKLMADEALDSGLVR